MDFCREAGWTIPGDGRGGHLGTGQGPRFCSSSRDTIQASRAQENATYLFPRAGEVRRCAEGVRSLHSRNKSLFSFFLSVPRTCSKHKGGDIFYQESKLTSVVKGFWRDKNCLESASQPVLCPQSQGHKTDAQPVFPSLSISHARGTGRVRFLGDKCRAFP